MLRVRVENLMSVTHRQLTETHSEMVLFWYEYVMCLCLKFSCCVVCVKYERIGYIEVVGVKTLNT